MVALLVTGPTGLSIIGPGEANLPSNEKQDSISAVIAVFVGIVVALATGPAWNLALAFNAESLVQSRQEAPVLADEGARTVTGDLSFLCGSAAQRFFPQMTGSSTLTSSAREDSPPWSSTGRAKRNEPRTA